MERASALSLLRKVGAETPLLPEGELAMSMSTTELAALLPAHTVFGACDTAEFEDLLASGSIHNVQANETILRQGDAGDALIVIIEGVARVSMVTSNGREIIFDYAEPGTVLGEI